MNNSILNFDDYFLCMLDEKLIYKICETTFNIENVGLFFSTKIKQKEYWINKLKNNEIWNDKNGYLVITDKEENVIGLIWHFVHCIESSFELGINIFNKKHRGKGLGEKALNGYSEYLFNTYDINRLQYNMVEGNIQSEELALKCGFTYEGTQRKALFIRGKWNNLKLYSKLRGE